MSIIETLHPVTKVAAAAPYEALATGTVSRTATHPIESSKTLRTVAVNVIETLARIIATSGAIGGYGGGGYGVSPYGGGSVSADITLETLERASRIKPLAFETSGAIGFVTATGTVWIETRRGGPIIVFPASRPGRILFVEPGRAR